MPTQTLTVKKIKAAARKAFEEGRLMAQWPRKAQRVCQYVGPDGVSGCAIGVALTKATRRAIIARDKKVGGSLNNQGTAALLASELVELDDDWAGRIEMDQIQARHDEWANYSRGSGARSPVALAAKKSFLEAIA